MENTYSQKFLQQRKFFTVLPIIIIPFTAILFWLLGGGSNKQPAQTEKTGLNLQLPDARLKSQSAMDKLSFYAMADRDSIKRDEQMRMDPNIQKVQVPAAEDALDKKIALLQRQISEPAIVHTYKRTKEYTSEEPVLSSIPVAQKKEIDPEIEALNGALEKILDIQHPERAKEKTKASDKSISVISSVAEEGDNSFFGHKDTTVKNNFHSIDESTEKTSMTTIRAVIHGTQILQPGSIVKIRLLNDIYVNKIKIVTGSFIYGNAAIENERLSIRISSIQFDNQLFNVALVVYDMDGLPGINIPGSESREVAKQSADQAIQSFSPLSMDPSIKAQTAAAGIGAAKSLLSRKVKLVRVTVKAGHQILLRDENQKEN